MYNIIPNSVLVPVIFLSYLNIIKPHVTSCSDKHYDSDEEEKPCSEEESQNYTPFYVWIGIACGVTVFLMVMLVSCLCCRCCLVHKRRRALQEATARSAEISTIRPTWAGPSSGDHIPEYPTQPMQGEIHFTTYPALHVVPHQSQSRSFQQRYPANQGNVYQGASSHPMYAPSAPPVHPDEPPPQYKP